MNFHRKCISFDAKDPTIKDLFEDVSNENNVLVKITDVKYRELQTKLAYVLINIHNSDSKGILRQILYRLSSYEKLEDFEQVFLKYLWLKEGMLIIILITCFNFFSFR